MTDEIIFQVEEHKIVVDAPAAIDADSIERALMALGFENVAFDGTEGFAGDDYLVHTFSR
jgi:uncharacterized protein Smg (DUF494 family)